MLHVFYLLFLLIAIKDPIWFTGPSDAWIFFCQVLKLSGYNRVLPWRGLLPSCFLCSMPHQFWLSLPPSLPRFCLIYDIAAGRILCYPLAFGGKRKHFWVESNLEISLFPTLLKIQKKNHKNIQRTFYIHHPSLLEQLKDCCLATLWPTRPGYISMHRISSLL